MKHKNPSGDQQQKLAGTTQASASEELTRNETNPQPSPDEVSRRAYFRYLNEGSPTGRDVQHWLEAEAHMMAEISRIHGFHN
jgi:hypothetical protein